ncbi:MAG: hypothetical protein KME21_00795 [Desmonostoc vinosum HA7617-LM4]|nr:hypothetical protein [Desmonostoc vinosum HA7617-LM4]
MGRFFRFRVLVDAGTRRKISERKNRLFQTEYEKPTLESHPLVGGEESRPAALVISNRPITNYQIPRPQGGEEFYSLASINWRF